MKWYEVTVDCGDGTSTQYRFKTREEAQVWRDKQEDTPYFQCDGDGSPVCEVDTDNASFFYDSTEEDEWEDE